MLFLFEIFAEPSFGVFIAMLLPYFLCKKISSFVKKCKFAQFFQN